MQFYPHNLPVTSIATAVSASLARTGSLITNFSAVGVTLVNTASLALNISGSRGAAGTNIAVIGPTGPAGPRGDTGYRGGNIFLLSGSWNTNACGETPLPCVGPYTLYNIGPSAGECGTLQGSGQYRTSYNGDPELDALTGGNGTLANGSILYTDSACTTVAANVSVHNGMGAIFYTNGAGVISSAGCSI